jgi:probable rRNA maturation factor
MKKPVTKKTSGKKYIPYEIASNSLLAPLAKVTRKLHPCDTYLSVQYACTEHAQPLPTRQQCRAWLKRATLSPTSSIELTLRFVDSAEMLALNGDFRGKHKPTNVLTFNYNSVPNVMTDIVVCPAVIETEAKEQSKALRSHYAHMVMHGVLHAQGYDHEEDNDALQMESLEIKLLSLLGITNPYVDCLEDTKIDKRTDNNI